MDTEGKRGLWEIRKYLLASPLCPQELLMKRNAYTGFTPETSPSSHPFPHSSVWSILWTSLAKVREVPVSINTGHGEMNPAQWGKNITDVTSGIEFENCIFQEFIIYSGKPQNTKHRLWSLNEKSGRRESTGINKPQALDHRDTL